MPTAKRPRYGSLQFYPRKRAAKFLPSVNWNTISSDNPGILGFITYKVGMASAVIKDSTEKSLTEKKRVTIPVTILEAPNMKIFSVRFYKNSKVIKDIIVSNDKSLVSKVKVPKTLSDFDKEIPEDYDSIHIIAYSLVKQTGVKKKPDLIELALSGPKPLDLIKPLIGKEIALADFLNDFNLFDVRGLTTGKGMQGPVKRFGITLKSHKSEKGRRNPGSIAPWHPAHVTFRTPMAGQLGLFSRVHYNHKLISSGTTEEKDINPKAGFKHYGKIKTSYIIIKGSVQGPPKRQILITPAFRPTKAKEKLNYEFIKLITK
ncbi:hypothetical protein CMI47_00210 [Candidatus Pacearchaeota archaeon]|nr:hypothetical protein [Candidatus Pacearchaeota archaeon]|tara:strand:- start:16003 stop:16953 length:951 start_codon:yes stop_codon:yes gene_type:complete